MNKRIPMLCLGFLSTHALSAQIHKVSILPPFSIKNIGIHYDFQINQDKVRPGEESALVKSLETQLGFVYPGNQGHSSYNLVVSRNLTKDQLNILRELRRNFEAHLQSLFIQWLELNNHKDDFYHGVVFKNLEKVKELSKNFCKFIEETVGPSYSFSSKRNKNPFMDLESFIRKNNIDSKELSSWNFESIGNSTRWFIVLEETIFKDYYNEKKQWVYPESIICQLSTFFMPAIETFDKKKLWRPVLESVGWQDMYNPLNDNLFATSERPDIESILQSLPNDKDTPSPLFFLHLLRKSISLNTVIDALKNGNFNNLLPHSLMFNSLNKACLKASDSEFFINKEKCLKAYKEDMVWFEIDTSHVLTSMPLKTHSLLAW